jgi:antitoxin ParD1/3/4
MNVSLTPELQKFVAERVQSGRYASASEVIREALRLLEDSDRLNQLRQDVRLGLEQLDDGHHRRFDSHALKRIKGQGAKRISAGNRRTGLPG